MGTAGDARIRPTAGAATSVVGVHEFVFGLSAAILLDATVVRAVLVPAGMAVLGDSNGTCPGGCAGAAHPEAASAVGPLILAAGFGRTRRGCGWRLPQWLSAASAYPAGRDRRATGAAVEAARQGPGFAATVIDRRPSAGGP